jgi:trans-aconitate methyltransferase
VAKRDGEHWAVYNDDQGGRAVHPLCAEVIELAGPGAGRPALDLGCGAGVETGALLAAGWRVHAIDSAPGTAERVRRTLTESGVRAGDRLSLEVADLAGLRALPAADLIHSGYTLQYLAPDDFHRIWALLRGSLQPGGWIAVNLLGDHDSWAGTAGETFLAVEEVRALFDGLEIVRFEVEDADGPAYTGPKHWHVFDVVARQKP